MLPGESIVNCVILASATPGAREGQHADSSTGSGESITREVMIQGLGKYDGLWREFGSGHEVLLTRGKVFRVGNNRLPIAYGVMS